MNVQNTWRSVPLWVLCLVGYLLIYVAPLGFRPLVLPDETRYAEIPREMLATHDWIVPRLVGLRYFEKPVLGYWTSALSLAVFGENAFAVRLPMAVSAGLLAFLLFLFVKRATGDRGLGALAVASALTSFGVFATGVFSCLDSVLALLLGGALITFYWACVEERRRRRVVFLALAGCLCGCAFLTKGFIAFAIVAMVVAPFLLWEKRWRDLFTLPWIPLVAVLVVALPWCIAIHLREADFWRYFFWVEHIQRFRSDTPQHAEPVWYYIPILVGGLMPWTLLVPAALIGLLRERRATSLVRFATCWACLPFAFFTISAGKVGTYLLPTFPAYVILLTVGLRLYFQTPGRIAFVLGAIANALLATGLALFVWLTPTAQWPSDALFSVPLVWLKVAICIALVAWGGLTALSARRAGGGLGVPVSLFAGGAALCVLSVHLVTTVLDSTGKTPVSFINAHRADIDDRTILVSDSYVSPAVAWVYKREDIFILANGGELTYGLSTEDSKDRFVTLEAFRRLVAQHAGGDRVVLILGERTYNSYREHLPDPISAETREGFTFARY